MTRSLRALWMGLLILAGPVLGQVVPGFYFVELSGEPAGVTASGLTRQERTGDRKIHVLAEQERARQTIRAAGGEVVSAVQQVANALVVRFPDSRASELAGIPGVVKVYPVREAHLDLDQALPLHKVLEAWQQLGGSARAGVGVKIGILDSGIETSHPGFDDPTLFTPEGYPKSGSKLDETALNRKIIVMRNYEALLAGAAEPDPKDHNGHGTAVAMIAAGMPVAGPYGSLSGVAQKAYLGIYKVFSGSDRTTREDVVIKALDDAVSDGMEVLNLSLGVEPAARPEDDILVAAVERASAAGVMVVKSAGNGGPAPNTLSSPGAAPSAVTVGAQWNQREFADPAVQTGGKSFPALPGTGPNPRVPIEAPLADVAMLEATGMACSPLTENSLIGKVAFILRGECIFEEKLNHAMGAGALAALLYSDEARPEPVIMSVGTATLPGLMVSHADGLAIRELLAATAGLSARLRFAVEAVPVNPLRLASFSSRGPSPDYSIKPDLVAAGVGIMTAAESIDPDGEVYSDTNYTVVDGTSFAAPLITGAAAVLKSARPGLTLAQYRSLLVNSTLPLTEDPKSRNPAQQAGTGMLNLDSALRNTLAVAPVSLSFGVGGGSPARSRELTVYNLDASPDQLTVTVEQAEGSPAAAVSAAEFNLGAEESARLRVDLTASGLAPGEYQGILRIRGVRTSVETRVPYWYAVPSNQPRYIKTITSTQPSPAIYARAVDEVGVVVGDVRPAVTVVSGGGSVSSILSVDSLYPGYWRISVQLGPDDRSVFRVRFGDASEDVLVDTTN